MVIQLIVQKAKQAGLGTIFDIMDVVFPMVTTSLSKQEILELIPAMIGYSVDDTVGFPMEYKFSNIKGSIIVPTTLVSNVEQLHKFLYGEDTEYTPSTEVQTYSQRIIEIVGGEEQLTDEAAVSSETDETTDDTFIWQDTDTGENGWTGDSGSSSDWSDGSGSSDNSGGTWTDPGTGGETTDPGTGGETTDPGTGGGTTDPGTGGGTTDPGTGGGTTDPGTGGGTTDPGTGGGTTDPGTGGGTTDPGTGGGTTDPGTGDGTTDGGGATDGTDAGWSDGSYGGGDGSSAEGTV